MIFYLNPNKYKTQDKHPDYKNAKVIVKEAIEPGVYDVACWMGENEKGKYMKVTFDPQTHLTQQDKKCEPNDDAPF